MKKLTILLFILGGCLIPAKSQTKAQSIGKKDSLLLVKLSNDLDIYESSLHAYVESMNVLLAQGDEALDTFNPEGGQGIFRNLIKITDNIVTTYEGRPNPKETETHLKILGAIVERGQSHQVYIKDLAMKCVKQVMTISELGLSSEEKIHEGMKEYSRLLNKTLKKYQSKYIKNPEEKKQIDLFLKTLEGF